MTSQITLFQGLILAIFFCFFSEISHAQTPSDYRSWRCKIIPFSEQGTPLDSISALPQSLEIRSVFPSISPKPFFYYDLKTNQIQFKRANFLRVDSVEICYQVLPFLISDTLRLRQKSDVVDSVNYSPELLQTQIFSEREAIFSDSSVQTAGNITQGISIGNAQNAQVNSSINLQIKGKITEKMELNVTLTDQNVPFQPEGNTQNIQDFDRILVQAKHPNFTATGGDIILQNPDTYFLKYYKNVQGASLKTDYHFLDDSIRIFTRKYPLKMHTQFSVSESKGQFHSQIVQAQEGVQGAYRLRGKNNERFIIILAGSEKVYLDGQLLTRGFENDYLIDYNTAEITFTNQIVITKYTRIRVDFEYANQNFSRAITAFEHQQRIGKLTWSANFYQEKDDPNSESARLTDNDIKILKSIGDDLQNAFGNTERISEMYSPNLILYKKIDTIYFNQKYENIYIRTTNPTDEIYTVSFAQVGQNQGNYILDNSIIANGNIFKWVAPIQNIPQGNYEPIRNLPAPNLKNIAELGITYGLAKHEKLFFNLAFSKHDKNLFSALQNNDNQGYAIKIGYESTKKKVNFLKSYQLSNLLTLEFNQRNFQPIDRFRSPDFDRDWSVQNIDSLAQDFILQTGIRLHKNQANDMDYLLTYRHRTAQAQGFQHQFKLIKKLYFFDNQTHLFWMNSTSKNTISSWQRISTDINYQTQWFRQGYRFSMDKNILTHTENDSIIGTAMFFDEHLFYLQNSDSAKRKFRIDYLFREDQIPVEGKMAKNTQIQAVNFSTEQNYTQHSLKWRITYRSLTNLQNFDAPKEVTLLNNLNYNFKLYKNVIHSEIGLINATGRELLRAFRYLQVANGQGTHTWRDDNLDGLQDLNEFYEAINPDEKNYVKIFTPTDNYTPAYTASFAYRLTIKPPKKWAKNTGFKKRFANFELNSAWTVERKITESDFFVRFIPLLNNLPFEKLLSKREILRGVIFYKRTSRKYGGEFSFLNSEARTLLSQGFEATQKQEFRWLGRYLFAKKQNMRLLFLHEKKGNFSDFLSNRNYQIRSWQVSPSWVWQPRNHFRLEGHYFLKIKENEFQNQQNELAKIHEFQFGSRLTKSTKRNVQGTFRLIIIDYDGITNSPAGYEMLEALQTGTNYNLSINWQERLGNGLQLTFQYNGRKSEGQKRIHWGNVRASFLF